MKTTTTKLTIIAAALLLSTTAHAAGTAINETGEMPDPSAILDARSETRGFLPPRMTAAQRGAISSPATGLQVYQTDGTAGLYVYNGAAWNLIGNATGTVSTANGGTGSTDGSITGSRTLTFTAGGTNQNVTLTPSGTGYTLLGGNVGIGTATPDTRLAVIEDASFNSINVRSGRAGGVVQRSFTTTLLEGSGANGGFHGNVALKFHHNENNNLSGDLSFWTKDDSNIQYERMRIAYNGNVGIGTTAPAAKLHVYGTQTGAAWAGMGAFGGASYAVILGQYNDKAYLGAHNAALNAWADLAINPGGGNVGIGTTTPNNKLQIGPTTYSVNSLAMGNGTQNFAIDISSRTIPTFFSDNNFSFMGSGGNGNVGIGTTTPYTTLTVGSTDATARITAGGPNTHLTLASAGPNGDIYLNAGGVASGNYSTSTRLSVGANGNVGIGTTSPAELLQVGTESAGTSARKTIKIGSGGYSAPAAFQTNSNGDKIILYNADGYDARIGIGGSTDMWFKSSDGGTGGQFKWYIGAGTNLIMQLSGNTGVLSMAGGAYCNGTTWVNASDARLKRDIQPMSKYGLSTVMQLKPVSYFYKADKTNHPEVGFIAQEVQKIVPEVVSGTEGDITKGETLGLSYGNLVPVLTKAIQEQQATIEALQKQIDELKSLVNKLIIKK